MYGDNRANEKIIDLNDVESMLIPLSESVKIDCIQGYSKEDVLALTMLSQQITDALNALYEQMKG
jgi:hypothetical protein